MKVKNQPLQVRDFSGEKLFRTFAINKRNIDEEKRTVELSFSSEAPVERYFGLEILDHGPDSMRLGRLQESGPVLMDHDSRDHVGVVESVEIGSDRKGRAVVRFGKSARASEVFADIVDGIRGNISVGYMLHKMVLEKEEKDLKTYRATDWEPMEISIVSVPADTDVGIGREQQQKGKEDMKKKHTLFHEPDTGTGGTATATPPETRNQPTPAIESGEDRSIDAVKEERARANEIASIGKKFNLEEIATRAIDSGMPVDEFRESVLKSMGASPIVDPDPNIGLSKKEIKEFSIVRALHAQAAKNLSLAPFEMECSDVVRSKLNREGNDGMSIPFDVISDRSIQRDQRDLTTNVDTAGGYLVQTNTFSFIELLRNSMMVRAMGAQVLSGLVGDIVLPKMSGGATSYWVDENADITESDQSFGQIAMTPHTVGALTDFSRRLLIQSSIDIENLVRSDLAIALAIAKDLACINGSGVDGQPLGILNVTGIGAVIGGANGAAPDWGTIVNLEKEVAKDNALIQNLGYLTNSDAVAKLKQTEKAAGTAQFIMSESNRMDGFNPMNGYRAGVSNQVPNDGAKGSGTDLSSIIFGNWRDLIIGEWGTVDVLADPYTGGAKGATRIRVLQDTDNQVRHPESFSAVQDVITL